jgi:hypothetical protein
MLNLEFAMACILTGYVGATDGKVGALLFNGEYFVTTPN